MKADTRSFVIFTTVGCIAAGGVGYAVWQSTSPDSQKVNDNSSIPTTSSSGTKPTSSSADMPTAPTTVAPTLINDPLLPPNAFVPQGAPQATPTKLLRPRAQFPGTSEPAAPGDDRGGNRGDNAPEAPRDGQNNAVLPQQHEQGNLPRTNTPAPATNRPTNVPSPAQPVPPNVASPAEPEPANPNPPSQEHHKDENSSGSSTSPEPKPDPQLPRPGTQLPDQHLQPEWNVTPETQPSQNQQPQTELTQQPRTQQGGGSTASGSHSGVGGPTAVPDAQGPNAQGQGQTRALETQGSVSGSPNTSAVQGPSAATAASTPSVADGAQESTTTNWQPSGLLHSQDTMSYPAATTAAAAE